MLYRWHVGISIASYAVASHMQQVICLWHIEQTVPDRCSVSDLDTQCVDGVQLRDILKQTDVHSTMCSYI
jgi:hypothetical protein